mmetsp:Transcript_32251/g.72754  ORF Transcript_32251/g.72754 Transcript_32251/m.72754 type:complete len:251 (-) Transcript_32251:140-892(-)
MTCCTPPSSLRYVTSACCELSCEYSRWLCWRGLASCCRRHSSAPVGLPQQQRPIAEWRHGSNHDAIISRNVMSRVHSSPQSSRNLALTRSFLRSACHEIRTMPAVKRLALRVDAFSHAIVTVELSRLASESQSIPRTSRTPSSRMPRAWLILGLSAASRVSDMRCDEMNITQIELATATPPSTTKMAVPIVIFMLTSSATLSRDSPPTAAIAQPASRDACVLKSLRMSISCDIRCFSRSRSARARSAAAD